MAAALRNGLLSLMVSVVFFGCASLNPNYEKPTVTLSSFNALPSEGVVPSFEIGLRVLNPNPGALNVQGIVYTISIQGFEVVKGVGRDFPTIEGYSEQEITLVASANLLSGIRLFTDVMKNQQQSLTYDFEARLDMGGMFSSIEVSESGSIDL